MAPLHHRFFDSPVGTLTLVATDDALVGLSFPEHAGAPSWPSRPAPRHPVLELAARELAAYFAGTLRAFTVPLDPQGTAVQREVWDAVAAIPFGQTRAYGEIARALGRPRAARAVGAANGRNPLSLLVPCHRVVGAHGALTGYAGGVSRKRWLLEHERHVCES